MTETGPAGRTVLVAGATSTSGLVATRALVGAGARVIAAGRDEKRLMPVADLGARTAAADLTDEHAVAAMADRLHAAGERVDGILHLVGGWRGGGGMAGQTDEDYRFLEQSFTALRHVTRIFWDDLTTSEHARIAMVSSTAVARPLAGGANYAAVKSASEAWMRAAAHGLAKTARDAAAPLRGAAVIFRVKSLAGAEERLAQSFIDLWSAQPSAVNDTIVDLTAS
jgi:NADP-dependent 3-hydroxy acid dehydrogenase YdfG